MLFIEKLLVLFPYFILGILQSTYVVGYENSFRMYLKETNFDIGGIFDNTMIEICTKTLPLFISICSFYEHLNIINLLIYLQ